MIAHLIRLVWARKRSNVLLMLEIFISFLVVFAVAVLGVTNLRRLSSPLGFEWDSVYVVSSSYADTDREQARDDVPERTGEILRELGSLPEVEAAAAAFIAPFEMAAATSVYENQGREVSARFTELSDDADEVLGLEVVQGRWFEPADDAFDWTPAVINRTLADDLFGEKDPIGQPVDDDGSLRVVGVVEHFRWAGELAKVGPGAVTRLSSQKANRSRPTRFMVRAAAGTTAAFEVEVLARAKAVVPEWTVTIQPLEEIRRRGLRMAAAPLVLAGIVAGSLMLMVMLGMVGVFWQAVAGRTHEIGLRRAMGGTRAGIYRQFLGEILIVTSISMLLACLLILQLPLLGMLGGVGWPTVLRGLLVTACLMYLLAVMSGLYPAWIAARVQPAAALHDE